MGSSEFFIKQRGVFKDAKEAFFAAVEESKYDCGIKD